MGAQDRVVGAARWVQGGAGHGVEERPYLFSSQGRGLPVCLSGDPSQARN